MGEASNYRYVFNYPFLTINYLENTEPFYFNNRVRRAVPFLVWQAATTSAAPTFFPAFKFEDGIMGSRLLTDGGVYINNPALNLLIRARNIYPHIEKQKQLLVSLGTGQFSPSLAYLENAGISNMLNIDKGWAKAIFGVAQMGTSAETEYQIAELLEYLDPQVFHEEQEYEPRYYRIQKKFDKDVPMDGISGEQLEYLMQLGDELVEEKREELDRLCATLKEIPQSELAEV